jgi:hypothetical protein
MLSIINTRSTLSFLELLLEDFSIQISKESYLQSLN